jgi:hypothetical protein
MLITEDEELFKKQSSSSHPNRNNVEEQILEDFQKVQDLVDVTPTFFVGYKSIYRIFIFPKPSTVNKLRYI